jgi:hypothetical protein
MAATLEYLKKLRPGVDVTVHGFRSSFSQWAEVQDHGRAYPQSVIHATLAHHKGDSVTKSYFRSDFCSRRGVSY